MFEAAAELKKQYADSTSKNGLQKKHLEFIKQTHIPASTIDELATILKDEKDEYILNSVLHLEPPLIRVMQAWRAYIASGVYAATWKFKPGESRRPTEIARGQHVCSHSCDLFRFDYVYICKKYGRTHVCREGLCDSLVENAECDTCTITCNVYPRQWLEFMYDRTNTGDHYRVDKMTVYSDKADGSSTGEATGRNETASTADGACPMDLSELEALESSLTSYVEPSLEYTSINYSRTTDFWSLAKRLNQRESILDSFAGRTSAGHRPSSASVMPDSLSMASQQRCKKRRIEQAELDRFYAQSETTANDHNSSNATNNNNRQDKLPTLQTIHWVPKPQKRKRVRLLTLDSSQGPVPIEAKQVPMPLDTKNSENNTSQNKTKKTKQRRTLSRKKADYSIDSDAALAQFFTIASKVCVAYCSKQPQLCNLPIESIPFVNEWRSRIVKIAHSIWTQVTLTSNFKSHPQTYTPDMHFWAVVDHSRQFGFRIVERDCYIIPILTVSKEVIPTRDKQDSIAGLSSATLKNATKFFRESVLQFTPLVCDKLARDVQHLVTEDEVSVLQGGFQSRQASS